MQVELSKEQIDLILDALEMYWSHCADEYSFYCDVLNPEIVGTAFEERVKAYPEVTKEIAEQQQTLFSNLLDLIGSIEHTLRSGNQTNDFSEQKLKAMYDSLWLYNINFTDRNEDLIDRILDGEEPVEDEKEQWSFVKKQCAIINNLLRRFEHRLKHVIVNHW